MDFVRIYVKKHKLYLEGPSDQFSPEVKSKLKAKGIEPSSEGKEIIFDFWNNHLQTVRDILDNFGIKYYDDSVTRSIDIYRERVIVRGGLLYNDYIRTYLDDLKKQSYEGFHFDDQIGYVLSHKHGIEFADWLQRSAFSFGGNFKDSVKKELSKMKVGREEISLAVVSTGNFNLEVPQYPPPGTSYEKLKEMASYQSTPVNGRFYFIIPKEKERLFFTYVLEWKFPIYNQNAPLNIGKYDDKHISVRGNLDRARDILFNFEPEYKNNRGKALEAEFILTTENGVKFLDDLDKYRITYSISPEVTSTRAYLNSKKSVSPAISPVRKSSSPPKAVRVVSPPKYSSPAKETLAPEYSSLDRKSPPPPKEAEDVIDRLGLELSIRDLPPQLYLEGPTSKINSRALSALSRIGVRHNDYEVNDQYRLTFPTSQENNVIDILKRYSLPYYSNLEVVFLDVYDSNNVMIDGNLNIDQIGDILYSFNPEFVERPKDGGTSVFTLGNKDAMAFERELIEKGITYEKSKSYEEMVARESTTRTRARSRRR